MPAANLVAKQQFSAFGQDYVEGDVVPTSNLAAWPQGTLERRLENGFVEYSEVEAPATPTKASK